jgi:hypothetical protein
MKLINLIPLKEIDFKNQDQFDAYIKQHELRPATKVTIAGKVTTAGQAAKDSEPTKGSSVFGKDSGGSVFAKAGGASADNSDWMDDLDSIDTSDIKGKANPDSDSWKHDDVFGATFKDPKTGKTTTVGDAYDREDDSLAYQKAFAYVSKFDPDGEAVMGTKAYDDLQKNAAPKAQLPTKASKLNYKHAEALEKVVNSQVGLKGYVDTDENTDAIMYNASSGNQPTYTLYFGGNSDYNKPDEFRVSLLPTYGNDPSNIGNNVDKTFKTGDEAMKFMVDVAKKYKKELEMDDDKNESIKLSSILPKKYTK